MSFPSLLQCIAVTLAVALWIVLPVQAGNSDATGIDEPALSGLDLIAQADTDDSDGDSEDSDYDSDSDSEDSDSDSEDDSDADSDEDSDDSDDAPDA